ncbi:MAG: hypothetical protein ACOC4K_01290 [Verrucomicrobiota bacterium]
MAAATKTMGCYNVRLKRSAEKDLPNASGRPALEARSHSGAHYVLRKNSIQDG